MRRRENISRIIVSIITGLLMVCNEANAQRIDVKGVRKMSKATDCANIVFKSDFDRLTVRGTSQDSIYKTKDCEYNHIWTQYIDLRYEREQGLDNLINRHFVLHTPYTKDVELIVPGKDKELRQAVYEYKVRVIDYFPMRLACEVDVVRLRDYFGLRMSAGKRWGGYVSFKFSGQKREGFNADEIGGEVDLGKKTKLGRIRNSYMAGVKYGIVSRDYPVYLYLGAGYGDDGSQQSSGKKKGEGRVIYYTNYTSGFETEIGANVMLFDFLSLSMGADAIVGRRIAFDINCTIGFAVDLTQ